MASSAIGPGGKALEVGCGNGSIAAWLAAQLAPGGSVVGVDLDLSLIAARAPDLEFRQGDILAGPVDPGGFDLVTARAVLHHLVDPELAIANLVAEPRPRRGDPADRARLPPGQRRRAAADQGILGRMARLGSATRGSITTSAAAWLRDSRRSGSSRSRARAETAVYNGGSPWAEYWTETVTELRGPLVGSGHLDDGLIDTFLAHCADPGWWTETISFTAVRGRKS